MVKGASCSWLTMLGGCSLGIASHLTLRAFKLMVRFIYIYSPILVASVKSMVTSCNSQTPKIYDGVDSTANGVWDPHREILSEVLCLLSPLFSVMEKC